ncbi:MAG: hypothetical protein UX07_C0009G0022 [Parcubacteria group bacterium GW2011_GWA2_45_30]|nr:MAG: hypothetical protein UX07_C0009G0022 [Parcubacteria group bacterium GW2011_GWA2_45_30]
MRYKLEISQEARQALKKLKQQDRALLTRVERSVEKVLENPEIGKPLRHNLKNNRRVHVGSFVLIYEIAGESVLLVDFAHHDKIYKRI